MPARDVETVSRAAWRASAAILADAFSDDPVFGWLLPDAGSRPTKRRRCRARGAAGPVAGADQGAGCTRVRYLEASNERCAALYRRLGFCTVETITPAGSPPLELMLYRG